MRRAHFMSFEERDSNQVDHEVVGRFERQAHKCTEHFDQMGTSSSVGEGRDS
jgi:hypothetical protein